MRILFTQRELMVRAGSEMFTIEAARALRSRGHEVIVWAQRHGELAAALQAYGVPVLKTLQEIPWTPDVIHGQHHMQTMAALVFFHGVPVIYHCHGRPWITAPPLHRQIRRYVAMTSAMHEDMATVHGVPRHQITTVKNFVNLERFRRTRPPPSKIRTALAFGNNFLPGPEMEHLRAICTEEGIALDGVGLHLGDVHLRPEHLLQNYDLVFAIGKCAIEAMACGCAVIPLTPGLAGTLVLPENFSLWASSNFAPRAFGPADQVSTAWLREQLAQYHPDAVAMVTDRLRSEHSLDQAIAALETVYQSAVQDPAPAAHALEHLRDTGLYLEKLGQDVDQFYAGLARDQDLRKAHESLQLEQVKKQKLRDRIHHLEERIHGLERKKNQLLRQWDTAVQLLRGGWLGRWFLTRIRRRMRGNRPHQSSHSGKDEENG